MLLRLAPAIAPVVLFGPALARGRMIGNDDNVDYYLPLYTLVARAWSLGQIPGWNPWSFSGSPLLASGPAAAFYPPHVLYLVLPNLVVYDLLLIAHFVIAGLGAAALARRLTGDEVAAAVAGVGFGLCGFMFGHITHTGLDAGLAWVPWVFLGLERLRERVTAWNLLLAGGALALVALPGEFQVFTTTLMALAVYVVVVTALDWRRVRARPILVAAALVAVALGLAAIQLLPTASILPYTPRGQYEFSDAVRYSFGWSRAPTLIFPQLDGGLDQELGGYPGLALLVFASAGLVAGRRDRRVYGVLAMGLVALLAALGPATPVAHLLHALPIYGQLQSWGRYAMIVDLAVALLAAYGVVALRDASARTRGTALRAALVVVGLVVVAAVVVPRVEPFSGPAVSGPEGTLAVLLPGAAAVAGAAIAAWWWRRPRDRAAVWVGLAVVALDLIFLCGYWSDWHDQPSFAEVNAWYSPPPAFGEVYDAPGGIDRYVSVATNPTRDVHFTDLQRVRSMSGYETLAPAEYLRRTGIQTERHFRIERPDLLFSPRSHVLDLLRVTTVASKTRASFRTPRLPEAFLVGEARRVGSSAALRGLYGTAPFDPARSALLDTDCGRACAGLRKPGSAGTARVVRWDTDAVHLDVAATRPGLVNVSQAWFPGWRGSVDGRSAPVVRSDGLITGVPVGIGRHRVVLRYVPPGLPLGGVITLLTILGLAAGIVAERLRATRAQSRPGAADRRRRSAS